MFIKCDEGRMTDANHDLSPLACYKLGATGLPLFDDCGVGQGSLNLAFPAGGLGQRWV
jgi:hypothetical protein